jgi:phosphopantothenoylcysteine decarboxylase/phosphopantothenate--cysteine ligase
LERVPKTAMKIILGVTGSIAAYKSLELCRMFTKSGHEVRVVLSEGGARFVTALSFKALSGNRVLENLWDDGSVDCMEHIRWGDWADVVVVAPASANFISGYRMGSADSALHALLLATRAPIVIAPAMNVNMWHHPQTQENVTVLKERGVSIVAPESGELACGWEGDGRLADIARIYDEVVRQSNREIPNVGDLYGKRVVVTGGPTIELIDAVRYITNRSSGKMGVALVQELSKRGAVVTFVHGPIQNVSSGDLLFGVEQIQVESALDMQRVLVNELFNAVVAPDLLIMAAAVSDVRPSSYNPQKTKKSQLPGAIPLTLNPDILQEISTERAKRGKDFRLVGFAVESGSVEELKLEMQRKKETKGVDCIVGNLADDSFDRDTNRVWILGGAKDVVEVPLGAKSEIARKIIDHLVQAYFL